MIPAPRLRRLLVQVLLAGAVGGILGCPKSKDDPKPKPPAAKNDDKTDAAAHSDEPDHEDLPKRIRLTKEVIADAKLKTAPVTKEILAVTLSLPGEVTADPDKSARLSTAVAGRLVDVRFKEGSEVKKGDVLAIVRVPEIGKVRSAFSATSAKAAAARANAERLGSLAEKGLAAKQEAVSAKAEADALDAEARALSDQLGALGMGAGGGGSELALRAPVSGVVVVRDAVVGQPVTTEQTIATIADLSEAWFLGRVFEKDLGRLKIGAKAEVQLNAYPKERFDGTIEYLGRQIDPVARTVTARIRVANRSDLLRIGLFGTARVSTGEEAKKQPALVILGTAVTEIGGKPVVFVRHADDDFELHEVVLGESSLGKVEVVNGLREGEQVVVDGVFTLKSAVLKGTIAEEEH
ncbi:MAG: efflux RND transporter periplasmic adaptor subunit [Deltaproteobacteria bacterium]|nr:efflux RND transporter periplasmic adaptor subunit [Deltaproteobacteria bacterium]